MEKDIDPVNHLYHNTYNDCEDVKMDGGISILQFNNRSFDRNFSEVQRCIRQLCKRSAVIVTSAVVEIDGYEMCFIDRI